jgi:DNA-binding transcriptional LysR family regulator
MSTLRLSLDALQVLDAIARCGSFAAAGEMLHRTTSTLSYTVRKLERDLDVELFDRSGHRATLTDAGRVLLDEGRAILDAAQTVERRVRTLGRGWEGEIEIAHNQVVPVERMLELIRAFYAAGHPTRVRLRSEVLGGVWEALTSQRADLALVEVPPGAAQEITHRPIGFVEFVFVVAPGHPLAAEPQPVKVATVRRHRIVAVADTALNFPLRTTGITPGADVLTVSSLQAKLQAQVMGLGVGFLPVPLAADAIARGELVVLNVTAPKPRLQLSVAWGIRSTGPAVRWFIERMQQMALV